MTSQLPLSSAWVFFSWPAKVTVTSSPGLAVPPGAGAERVQETLTPLIAPADRYAMHILLIAHGRRTCRARRPACNRCCILDYCPFGREHAGEWLSA